MVVARARLWIESGDMAVVATIGNRTATRGPGETRRCEKRTGKDGRIIKGEMNEEARGASEKLGGFMCLEGRYLVPLVIGASSSNNDNKREKAPPTS